jgi:hypothetical protein
MTLCEDSVFMGYEATSMGDRIARHTFNTQIHSAIYQNRIVSYTAKKTSKGASPCIFIQTKGGGPMMNWFRGGGRRGISKYGTAH